MRTASGWEKLFVMQSRGLDCKISNKRFVGMQQKNYWLRKSF